MEAKTGKSGRECGGQERKSGLGGWRREKTRVDWRGRGQENKSGRKGRENVGEQAWKGGVDDRIPRVEGRGG
ncbi:hypothetical protein Pmani_003209 [Petrolisthes manimaculis]|uniref:Uncharacterized protein n=1 Tax=Petrolisthes manimaculis TaxID=1843537 RepID=A0AAE1UQ89_9EUCA|nr:hypothetical protein Pmani_024863 [Petrolisthes manimaculis]KAK4326254.1 hypothetical protein Pmani_003209 [Petrolisthes manimaculis]